MVSVIPTMKSTFSTLNLSSPHFRGASNVMITSIASTPTSSSSFPLNTRLSPKCLFSTSSSSLSSTNLPPNLVLADASILNPLPKPIIPADDYLFPTLNIPSQIAVSSFSSTPTTLDVVAPLDKRIFGVAIRKDIVHEVIRYHRHMLRKPKRTKRIGEIHGSTKKPRPQKGTGSSQVGHKRNSAWRGGMKAHGPVLRDYSIGLNKKTRALGMMIALAAKFREGNMIVFDKIACDSHKTKQLQAILNANGIQNSTIIVDTEISENVSTACQNLTQVVAMKQKDVGVYDLMKKEKLALSVDALRVLQERILSQYTHTGKRKALLEGLKIYRQALE